ncbi:hypothetical protein O0L34_g12378 [Tuta absoluta]|nr:hypothetical protein O0L34_g12378 [Tuta absoluta]
MLDSERVALTLSPSTPECGASNGPEKPDANGAEQFEDVLNYQKRPGSPKTTNTNRRTESTRGDSDFDTADSEVSVPVSIKCERVDSPPPQTINGKSSPGQSSLGDNYDDDPLHTSPSRPTSRATAAGQSRRASRASNTKRQNAGNLN